MPHQSNTINYIEFPLRKNAETQHFYSTVFGWEFTQWGPNYLSFSGAGIDGGFNGEDDAQITSPGVLVVLYSSELNSIFSQVEKAGAKIIRPIYAFPGGKRFHFLDPNGNELAIWSEQ